MLNQFSNTANLILTAIFFHPLFPLAIPIAFVGIVVNYWANKVFIITPLKFLKIVFLRRMRVPEQMSSLMALFFANLIPYFAFLWSLSLLLFYRTLYHDVFELKQPFTKTLPALACLIFALILLLLPIRSCINKCYQGRQGVARETYD